RSLPFRPLAWCHDRPTHAPSTGATLKCQVCIDTATLLRTNNSASSVEPARGVLDRFHPNSEVLVVLGGGQDVNLNELEHRAISVATVGTQFFNILSHSSAEFTVRVRHLSPGAEISSDVDVRIQFQEVLRRRLCPPDVITLHRLGP